MRGWHPPGHRKQSDSKELKVPWPYREGACACTVNMVRLSRGNVRKVGATGISPQDACTVGVLPRPLEFPALAAEPTTAWLSMQRALHTHVGALGGPSNLMHAFERWQGRGTFDHLTRHQSVKQRERDGNAVGGVRHPCNPYWDQRLGGSHMTITQLPGLLRRVPSFSRVGLRQALGGGSLVCSD